MDNNNNSIDLNKQLFSDFKNILFNQKEANPCDFCKFQVTDCSKNCKNYQEGVGVVDENGNFFEWKWTCFDWEFGTCDRLENTPCHNCWAKNYNFVNWEYKNIC